ncbi:MAG: hypothetical protein RMJ36_02465 [Candidatus Calescibacterium sp.]|nr:hypothetical protein [Candidatus Calescibacterium sp.]MDW8132502.1 hypothetical protein [Candidatus Calescibacterium sp.]
MNINQKIKLLEILILFNTYNYDHCKDYILNLLQESDSVVHYQVILKILEIFDLIREERFVEINEQINQIIVLMDNMDEDHFNKNFKELVNQIIEDFKVPSMGIPRKKVVINWHILLA